MANYLYLIPLLPLVAFVINFLFGRNYLRDRAAWIAVPAVFASFVLSLITFFEIRDKGEAIDQHIYTWIPSGSFQVNVNLHVDQLTAIMLLVVTSVGFLVHLYSTGYMHGDGGFYRFFSYLPLFVFSMLMLVLADNYLVVFIFWEAVGLCSYLLIGYYFKRRSASNAAKKAFIVNRVGDLGFGLAIMWIYTSFGTLQFFGDHGVFHLAQNGEVSSRTLTGISLLLFMGAMGKSAQFPLHVWLPDAMEGPTPVSALIHAATMVTAGIYLIARSYPIVSQSHTAMFVIATIGAFTALMAASIAVVQNDIKRVVAYSTVSQLGYMAMALGTGAWASGVFHLMTHAFFKGLLFLGCGAVIHGMHEEQDIQRMGGLRKYMPIAFWTFLIGSLANAGVVPFSGFWSKDETIAGAWASPIFPNWGKLLAIVALLAAFMTAFYMFRVVFLTFFGKSRFDEHAVHPHESGWQMTVPLVILAVPSTILGFLVGFPPDAGSFHTFIEPVFSTEATEEHAAAQTIDQDPLYILQETEGTAETGTEGDEHTATDEENAATEGEHAAGAHHEISDTTKWTFGIISTIVALSGIGLAYLMYMVGRISPVAMGQRYNGMYQFLYDRWRIDEFYDRTIVQPLKRLSMFLWQVIDVRVIDGTVNGLAKVVNGSSARLRTVQTGLVSNYALAIALGMVLIIGVYFAAFSDLIR